MYDCHYDLLTYILMNKANLKDVKKHCDAIFNNNITGGIFNLFYMSKKEMYNELGMKPDDINIIENLEEVKKIIKENRLIPEKIDYKIGIEGLDYLEKLEDIDILYELGVRSVNLVWNNHNKYGTGVRPIEILNKRKGLTTLGKRLIKKLIEKGIAIDLSHCDEATFWDIIDECKKYRKLNPKVLASHSNCKAICDVPRNLTDEQIRTIAEFNGIIGAVSVKSFCSQNNNANFKEEYIKHIIHIKEVIGNVNNIVLATDDMSYYNIEPDYYQNINIFKQKEIDKKVTELLEKNSFFDGEIEQIKYLNFRSMVANFINLKKCLKNGIILVSSDRKIWRKKMNNNRKELARECVLSHNMPWQIFSMLPPYTIWEADEKLEIALTQEFFFMTNDERKEEILNTMKTQLEERFKTSIVDVNPAEDGSCRITVKL